MQANLAVVDITNADLPGANANGAVVLSRLSSTGGPGGGTHFNAYQSIVTANYFTNAVGWFYYSQKASVDADFNDPCKTTYVGKTNTNVYAFDPWKDQVVDNVAWPTIPVVGADYVGTVQRGLPGGAFLPTFHKSVVAASGSLPFDGCTICQNKNYTVGIFSAVVTP